MPYRSSCQPFDMAAFGQGSRRIAPGQPNFLLAVSPTSWCGGTHGA